MPDWLPIVGRPLTLIALLFTAWAIARVITPLIPAGRFKSFITRPLHIAPRTEREAHDWLPVAALLIASAFLFGLVTWLGWDAI